MIFLSAIEFKVLLAKKTQESDLPESEVKKQLEEYYELTPKTS